MEKATSTGTDVILPAAISGLGLLHPKRDWALLPNGMLQSGPVRLFTIAMRDEQIRALVFKRRSLSKRLDWGAASSLMNSEFLLRCWGV